MSGKIIKQLNVLIFLQIFCVVVAVIGKSGICQIDRQAQQHFLVVLKLL